MNATTAKEPTLCIFIELPIIYSHVVSQGSVLGPLIFRYTKHMAIMYFSIIIDLSCTILNC